ncbi:MAG: Asp23/Gls24 family envelope stress response protein, partial [Chloroflexota bacterium]|nr:Asp23/Gls24 family envelope stress response protein [Chloroflexota bacterium]
EVARQVDSAVRYAIRRALGREVSRLTIHVDGLRYQPGGPPPTTMPADPASVATSDLADSGTDVA